MSEVYTSVFGIGEQIRRSKKLIERSEKESNQAWSMGFILVVLALIDLRRYGVKVDLD